MSSVAAVTYNTGARWDDDEEQEQDEQVPSYTNSNVEPFRKSTVVWA